MSTEATEIPLEAVRTIGRDLVRPECVLATASGDLFTADWRGGVHRLRADGSGTLYTGSTADIEGGIRPNGIALARDGSFLIAHLGDEQGGVWRLDLEGQLQPVLIEVEGEPLPPTNYVMIDHQDRIWVTVSTRRRPRHASARKDVGDGFIILLDERGARIVADGLGYTNEVQVSPDRRWLWVNETFERRTSRFELHEDGALGPRQTVCEYGVGTFPDGLAFDEEGSAWITSIVSNRVIRVTPDGRQTLILEDADAGHVEQVEEAYRQGRLAKPILDIVGGRKLRNVSSLAFGGPDLRTAYLGCLQGDHIACFDAPVAGLEPVHWHWGEHP